MKREELDFAGILFGYKVEYRPYEFSGVKYERHLVKIYLEDDEWWSEELVFDSFWLDDLKKTVDDLHKKYSKSRKKDK